MTKQFLKISYTLAICIMIAVLVTSFLIVNNAISSKKDDSTIINIAGRQRMLSQRITHLALRFSIEKDTTVKSEIQNQLQLTVNQWQQAHHALQFGDEKLHIRYVDNNDYTQTLFRQIEPSFSYIVVACKKLFLTNDKATIDTIVKEQEHFLQIMDTIVKEYEKRSNEKLAFIQQLETILLVIALVVIFLEVVFIFKPALKKVNTYIQSLKNLDDKLKESEALFKNAFHYSAVGMTIADIDGQLLQVNESICQMIGYTKNELLHQNLNQFIVKDDIEKDTALFKELLNNSRKSYTVEKRFLNKENKIIWTLLSVSIITNNSNDSVQIVSQIENITAIKEAEIALVAEKKLLRTIIDNLPINVYVKDVLSRKMLANKAEVEYMGAKDESEILGKSDVELFPSDSAKISLKEDQLVLKHGEAIIDKETYNFKIDGGDSWFLTSKIPLKNDENQIIGLLGISHNISERKAIEHKLEVALNNLQNILDATHQVSIIGTDVYGTITIFNKGAERLLGYSANEVIHKNSPIIFHKLEEVEKRSEELSVEFNRSIQGFDVFVTFANQNEFDSREWTYTRKDGSTFPVQLIITPMKDLDGTVTGYLGVAVDITNLKKSQIALKQSELQFRALFELSPVGIALNDYTTGNFLDANHSLLSTTGYTKEQIKEKNFWNIMPIKHKKLKVDILKSLRENGLYGPFESEYIKENNKSYPVLITGVQITDANGRILLWSVIQDISEIKQKETQLNTLNKEIEKRNTALQITNKELEQFAYVASHDLQEPLRMISGFLTKLEKKYRDQLDENALQYIFFAVDGAARMRNLITDLLAYSRAGKVEYQTEIVNIAEILTNVVSLLRTTIEEKKADISWTNMPTLRVAQTPIQQLFLNLISNGIKYQKEKNVPKIIIEAKELEKHWQFAVADNGIGIEPEYFEKIFTIFQRLHNKEKFAGTGIGLAICKKIVAYHQGEIWLESIPYVGTTFFFTLSKEIN